MTFEKKKKQLIEEFRKKFVKPIDGLNWPIWQKRALKDTVENDIKDFISQSLDQLKEDFLNSSVMQNEDMPERGGGTKSGIVYRRNQLRQEIRSYWEDK